MSIQLHQNRCDNNCIFSDITIETYENDPCIKHYFCKKIRREIFFLSCHDDVHEFKLTGCASYIEGVIDKEKEIEPFGCPGFCCHTISGLYMNWIFCELVENGDHTGFESCQKLRETGRCLHP